MTSEEWKQVTEKLIAAGGGNFNISTGEKVDIPQSILQAVKTSGTTLALHTSAGMALSISKENLTDSMLKSGINANVKVGMSNIPGNLKAQKAAGAVLTKEVSITGSDFFGGIVNMHWALGADNYGKYANLYFYNRETGKLELLGYYVINQDGQAMFGIDGGGEFLVTVTSSRPTEKVTVRFVNRQYLVKPGDTLYGIANKYNMSLKELISKNAQIRNPSKIKVGEKIIIR